MNEPPSVDRHSQHRCRGGEQAFRHRDEETCRSHAACAEQAEGFETQFLNSMFQEMYKGIGGDGPFGNSQGVGPWRSFLTEEYSKIIVKSGGVGIANAVYKSMLAQQEARAQGHNFRPLHAKPRARPQALQPQALQPQALQPQALQQQALQQ